MEERFQTFTVLIANVNRYIRRIKTEEMAEFQLKSHHVSCLYYLYRDKELTAKERIRLKDTSDAIKLDEATKEGEIVITPASYAVLQIHNEKSENKDYNNYVFVGGSSGYVFFSYIK